MAGNLFEAIREALIGGNAPQGNAQTFPIGSNRPFQGQDVTPSLPPMQQSPSPAMEQQNEPSLLSKFHQAMSDPEKNAQIVMALNSMRFRPDQSLAASMQKRIDTAQATRLATAQANKTVAQLKAMGRDDLAGLVEASPSLALDALKSASGINRTISGIKTSEVMVDPNTGQQFVVKTDPNTGDITRENIEGAIGVTPEQKLNMEMKSKLREQDVAKAQLEGSNAFSRMQSINSMIGSLGSARNEIVNNGAKSGIVTQYLPAFDAATQQLRTIANQMGIDIINSATFGALSAPELRLALQTGLPMNLEGKELVDYIDNKIAAQSKLRDELWNQARALTSGIGYSEFIQQFQNKGSDYSQPEYNPEQTQQQEPVATTETPTSESGIKILKVE